jgi:hypothetical protein
MDIDVGYIKSRDDDNSLMSIDESGKIRKTWAPEEDKKLVALVQETKGRNWKKIANVLGNKSGPQCSYRYNKLINEAPRAKWNRNEDIQLLELIEAYGHNWTLIANKLPGKTPEEAKSRFTMKLDPKLKRSRFDKNEDELILRLLDKFGNKWHEISKYFPNRNSAMIKNRYYSYLKNKNKDSTTLNITGGSETLSNCSLSMTPSIVRPSYSNFKVRNTISYNDTNLNNFKEKMLSDCNILDYNDVARDIDMFIVNPPMTYEYGKTLQNCNDDIYTSIWSTLPHDLIKFDENSPNIKDLEPEEKFREEYNNVFNFSMRKENFEDEEKVSDNDNLMKQYQLLESVFNKIYEVSSKTVIYNGKNLFILGKEELFHMDKKLEEKRELLSVKLEQLKNDYLMIIRSNIQDKGVIKNSLLKQIEVLVELINTVKIKINLIQQIEKGTLVNPV